jgi:hypothetical protein
MDQTAGCAAVRERLLDAEPAELRGAGDTPVAMHVRSCTRCAAAAARILSAHDELAGALATLATARTSALPVMHRSRRRLIGMAAPLAAAAALVLFLVQRRPDSDLPLLEPPPEQVAMATDVPVVNVTADDDVAIMRTSNPNITVVWYLKRER